MKLKALLVVLVAFPLFADTYMVDKDHSQVGFGIRHLMTNVHGKFEDFEGKIEIVPNKPDLSSVEFTIRANTVNSGVEDRDHELRGPDFFDVAKYPDIVFKSTAIKKSGNNLYSVTGNLTLRGVTKRITIPVTVMGFMKDPWNNERAGFELTTKLNRQDYGIKWNKALDNGGVLLGDEV